MESISNQEASESGRNPSCDRSPSEPNPESSSSFSGLIDDLLRFVFHPECLLCGKPLSRVQEYFCEECRASAEEMQKPLCPLCRAEIDDASVGCKSCVEREPISILWTCGLFDDFHRSLVHAIKYSGLTPLAVEMGVSIADRIAATGKVPRIDVIVPVPLHWTRKKKRGFNQCDCIAEGVAISLGIAVSTRALSRKRRTLDQTGLSSQERIRNMQGAFEARRAEDVRGKRVLLIDDVTTTGATLNEAAEALRLAGCRNVYAAVIAVASL